MFSLLVGVRLVPRDASLVIRVYKHVDGMVSSLFYSKYNADAPRSRKHFKNEVSLLFVMN